MNKTTKFWLADRVSDIFNPYYASGPFFLLVAFKAGENLTESLLYAAVFIFFFGVLPVIDIKLRVRRGLVSDGHLSRREDRIKPFLVSLVSSALGVALLGWLGAPPVLLAVGVVVIVAGAFVTTVTLFWKISLHVSAVTSIVAMLVIIFGWRWLPLAAVVPLVFWARLVLKKHTLAQAVAGALSGLGVTIVVFALFGLLAPGS